MVKRCICGRSTRFPICDGSHSSEDWACRADGPPQAQRGFLATTANRNLAERLAASCAGVVVSPGREAEVAELVMLTDGTDLDELLEVAAGVAATRRRAIALEIAGEPLALALAGWEIVAVPGGDGLLWPQLAAAVTTTGPQLGEDQGLASGVLEPAFLSHAVADEARLQRPLDYLRRRYGADLFVCADSIEAGSPWHSSIVDELRARPRFVLLLSRASLASTFCAFEAGMALATDKAVRLISLDGSPPPAYFQHLHMLDAERRANAKPWLPDSAIVSDLLLEALR